MKLSTKSIYVALVLYLFAAPSLSYQLTDIPSVEANKSPVQMAVKQLWNKFHFRHRIISMWERRFNCQK